MSGRILYVPIRIKRKPTIDGQPVVLPEGCDGLLFVYTSEEAARKASGDDVLIAELRERIELVDARALRPCASKRSSS